jgi:hypothetical protein
VIFAKTGLRPCAARIYAAKTFDRINKINRISDGKRGTDQAAEDFIL